MIQTERCGTRKDGVTLFRTFSDAALMIRKDGTELIYAEAVDVENSGFAYIETEIRLRDTEEPSLEDTLAMLNELGVDTDDQ